MRYRGDWYLLTAKTLFVREVGHRVSGLVIRASLHRNSEGEVGVGIIVLVIHSTLADPTGGATTLWLYLRKPTSNGRGSEMGKGWERGGRKGMGGNGSGKEGERKKSSPPL